MPCHTFRAARFDSVKTGYFSRFDYAFPAVIVGAIGGELLLKRFNIELRQLYAASLFTRIYGNLGSSRRCGQAFGPFRSHFGRE